MASKVGAARFEHFLQFLKRGVFQFQCFGVERGDGILRFGDGRLAWIKRSGIDWRGDGLQKLGERGVRFVADALDVEHGLRGE